jgi:hypothetical protein
MKTFLTLVIKILSIKLLSAVTTQCPKYTCPNEKKQTCAQLTPTLATQGFNKIELFDTCPVGTYCNIPGIVWQTLTTSNETSVYNCTDVGKLDLFLNRYPGESCEKDTDCYYTDGDQSTGSCKNSKCTGRTVGEFCISHSSCLTGLFCDGGKCAKQKRKDNLCKDSAECSNELLCHEGQCSLKPYTLGLGKFVGTDSRAGDKCVLSMVDGQGRCTALNQTISTVDPDLNMFRRCGYGDACAYTLNGLDTKSVPCECGFNTAGYGYCPKGQNISK